MRNYSPVMRSKRTVRRSSQLDEKKNCFKFPSLNSGHLVRLIWIDDHLTIFTRQRPERVSAHNIDTGLNSKDRPTVALVTVHGREQRSTSEKNSECDVVIERTLLSNFITMLPTKR